MPLASSGSGLAGFGDDYLDRNAHVGAGRDALWNRLLTDHPVSRVLEVGCNVGANLQWIVQHVDPAETFGIDVNEHGLSRLRQRLQGVKRGDRRRA